MRLNIEMKKIENNYCLEYNNGSVLFCSVLSIMLNIPIPKCFISVYIQIIRYLENLSTL